METQIYWRDGFLRLMEDYMLQVLNFTPRLSSSNSGATHSVLPSVFNLKPNLEPDNTTTHLSKEMQAENQNLPSDK